MKIIVNNGRMYLSELGNDSIEIFTDKEIASFDADFSGVMLGATRPYTLDGITACADTTAMLEEYKQGIKK